MIRKEWFLIAVLILFVGTAFVFNSVAQVDGNTGNVVVVRDDSNGAIVSSASRFSAVWLLPLAAVLLYALFATLSRVAVYKPHLDNFFDKFFTFRLTLVLLLYVMFWSVIMSNIGIPNQHVIIMIAVAIAFGYLGHIFHHAKSDDLAPWIRGKTKHWYDTHHLGAYVFWLSGLIVLVGIFFKDLVLLFLSISTFMTFVMIVLYGIIIFRKEHKATSKTSKVK